MPKWMRLKNTQGNFLDIRHGHLLECAHTGSHIHTQMNKENVAIFKRRILLDVAVQKAGFVQKGREDLDHEFPASSRE